MIAAIYARKSTDQQGVSEQERSVSRQVDGARDYAASKGWAIAEDHIYIDDGVSGAEFANRPGFLRLMNSLKPEAPFDVLIMSEESRLGREQIETSFSLKQLVQAGVSVWYYIENRQRTLDTPTDKIMASLTAFADELEREKARQRTKDALLSKAKKGYVTGGRVFGYDNHEVLGPDGERSHVEYRINEEEAEVVREIFQLCADGYGKTRTAKTLNERGRITPQPRKGRPRAWAPSSIQGILGRTKYRGLIRWNKSKKRDSWGRKKGSARPESEWLEVEAPQLRIVSDELWEAAHARLEATRATYLRHQNGQLWGRPPDGVGHKYLLTGISRCGECGDSLEMRSSSRKKGRAYYYACRGYYRKSSCENKALIPMTAADRIVIDTVLAEILTPARLASVAEQAVELAKAEQAQQPDIRAGLERQLQEAQTALDRLTAAVAEGGDVPSLVEAIKVQDNRRKELERRLEQLDVPPPTFDAALEQKLMQAVDEWREVLDRNVPQARQIIQKLLADRITFTPEERNGRKGFIFNAEGTVEKLIDGAIPRHFPRVVAPTGFEPVSPA